METKLTKCYKDPKSGKWKVDRAYQRKRGREWRQKWYALGYTYKRIGGHWGWIKRKPRPVRARIHSNDQKEIARVRKKIMGAGMK